MARQPLTEEPSLLIAANATIPWPHFKCLQCLRASVFLRISFPRLQASEPNAENWFSWWFQWSQRKGHGSGWLLRECRRVLEWLLKTLLSLETGGNIQIMSGRQVRRRRRTDAVCLNEVSTVTVKQIGRTQQFSSLGFFPTAPGPELEGASWTSALKGARNRSQELQPERGIRAESLFFLGGWGGGGRLRQ